MSFRSEEVDLTSLHSVLALSKLLLETLPRLDVAILNAGYGGYIGLDWFRAIWTILTDFPHAVTYPTYAIAASGQTTKRQTDLPNSEPGLGQVFCSNVFGHYMLINHLAPLLNTAPPNAAIATTTRLGRIIWVSSLEAYASSFSPFDIQGISSPHAYKSSKRLTDILALTSTLPSSAPEVKKWLQQPDDKEPLRTRIYLSHPGICATSFVPLPFPLLYIVTFVFYIARWIGSPWHTASSYKGACAPVWLTLSPQEELDAIESDGAGKWGSCVDMAGNERVTRTEVEGWGWRGIVEPLRSEYRSGRRRGVTDLTEEQRVEFEQLGKECWEEMNRLNKDWRDRMVAAQTRGDGKV